MSQDLADHPFSRENIAYESGAPSSSERAYFRWCAKVEALLGHDLDGNDAAETGCGYSLDEACDIFDSGTSPEDYVEEIKARPRYLGEWQGRS